MGQSKGKRYSAGSVSREGWVALFLTLLCIPGQIRSVAATHLTKDETEECPCISTPEPITVDATGLYTAVDLGVTRAVDKNGTPLAVVMDRDSNRLPAGVNRIVWRATDAAGTTRTATQTINVVPVASISKDDVVVEGTQQQVIIRLSGESPVYPLEIPFTVSGSATSPDDHTLTSGSIIIESGTEGVIRFETTEDAVAEEDENIIIRLGDSVNSGLFDIHTTTITEANVAPRIALFGAQNLQRRWVYSQQEGGVVIRADVIDPNPDSLVSYNWEGDLEALGVDITRNNRIGFDPARVSPGVYRVAVTASDDAPAPKTDYAEITLEVVSAFPDEAAPFKDVDQDGIEDTQDPYKQCNLLPQTLEDGRRYTVEGETGVCLKLGNDALATGGKGVLLTEPALVDDTPYRYTGGLFDIETTGRTAEGLTQLWVLPQRSPLLDNSIFRLFRQDTGWTDFVGSEQDTLHSAPGEPGYCPPPGDANWQAGLTPGHWCVQIQILDGGPNDRITLANGAVSLTGGIAVPADALGGNTRPVTTTDSIDMMPGQSVTIDVLANDSDAEGNNLVITHVISTLGTASLTDGQMIYSPPDGYLGQSTLYYTVSDGTLHAPLTPVKVNVLAPDVYFQAQVRGGGNLSPVTLLLLLCLLHPIRPNQRPGKSA